MALTEKTKTPPTFRGFLRGLNQIKVGDYKRAKGELAEALGINNRTSWAAYLHGQIEPKAGQAAKVTAVFAKYGITKDIWGTSD